MTRYTTFGIPQERGQQLRQLARDRGITVGDLVVSWIVGALESSGQTVEYKPFDGQVTVQNGEGAIHATFFGQDQHLLTLDQAFGFIEGLKLAIIDGGVHTFECAGLGDQTKLGKAARRGGGFMLTLGEWKRTMSLTVAQEIARGLETCCTELRSRMNDQEPATGLTKQHPNFGLFA